MQQTLCIVQMQILAERGVIIVISGNEGDETIFHILFRRENSQVAASPSISHSCRARECGRITRRQLIKHQFPFTAEPGTMESAWLAPADQFHLLIARTRAADRSARRAARLHTTVNLNFHYHFKYMPSVVRTVSYYICVCIYDV